MIEEISWALLGIIAGIFTGLLPGIHANTIAFIALLLPFDKTTGLAMFIVSMGISHSIFDSIPSILLGAPSEESSVNVLPGHQMLLRGKGLEAIELTVFGSLMTGMFAIALAPIFFSFAKNFGRNLPLIIPALVAGTILLLLISEKNKIDALAVSIGAGLLGLFILNSGVMESVFVLIVGFFGLPGLIQSVFANTKIPEQEKSVQGSAAVNLGFVSALTSGFLAVFPGIGPSQSAQIVKTFFRKLTAREYLVLNGGINTGNLFFSAIMLYSLGKTRTGMAVALESAIRVDFGAMLILCATALFSIGICAAIVGPIAARALKWVKRIDYRKVSAATIIFLLLLVAFFSGIAGLAACMCACGISIFALGSKVRRSHCMAFLLFPTLAFYLGISI